MARSWSWGALRTGGSRLRVEEQVLRGFVVKDKAGVSSLLCLLAALKPET